MGKLLQELKRRNVIKETIAYLVVAWLILQVFAVVLPIWKAPEWILQIITVTLAIGLPLWVVFSWHYQFTSSGIKRTEALEQTEKSSRFNRVLNITIMLALVAVIALIWIKPSIITAMPSDKLSIAVLPFTNMSDDKSNDWFSIGVTEDILTHLSKVNGLRVISRTSVMQYRDSDKSLPEIAKELDVAYVVEGSVRKQNEQVLITAQLLNANDEHLWAENYDEDLLDAFKIQQEVSQKIVDQLSIIISPEEKKALKKASSKNAMALELFSKGRSVADDRTQESLEKSIELYRQAIEQDSLFAEAYAEISNSYVLLVTYGNLSWPEAKLQARSYIDKALAIDDQIARPYTVLAFIYMTDKKFDLAKSYFEKAIKINPNDATAHHHFALFYRSHPDASESTILNYLKEITEAQKLDPLSMPINQMKFYALLANGRLEEAKEHSDKTRVLNSFFNNVRQEGLLNSMMKKDLREWVLALEKGLEEQPDNMDILNFLRWLNADVMLDRAKSLVYSKKISELDTSSGNYAFYYTDNMIRNKNFSEALNFLSDSVSSSTLDTWEKTVLKQRLYAYKGDYDLAWQYQEQLKPLHTEGYYFNKAWLYSFMGDDENTYKILDHPDFNPDRVQKAFIFANLGKRDSLYHYLNQIANDFYFMRRWEDLIIINGKDEIDPYRNDSLYTEILRQNYFPLNTYEK